MLLVRVRQRPEVRAPISQEISQQEVNVEGILPGVRLARTEVVIMEMVITGVVITEVVIMEVVFREGVSHMVVFQEGVLGAFLVVEDFQVGFLEAEAFLEAEVFLVEAASRQVVGDWTLDSWRLVDNDWALPAGH